MLAVGISNKGGNYPRLKSWVLDDVPAGVLCVRVRF